MRDEYDFSSGARGTYAARYAEGTNVVLLDPDVYEYFRDSASVNEARRLLVKLARQQARQAEPSESR
jgi:hypothetical protein